LCIYSICISPTCSFSFPLLAIFKKKNIMFTKFFNIKWTNLYYYSSWRYSGVKSGHQWNSFYVAFFPSFWRYFTHKWHTFSCILFLTIIYVRTRESSYHLGCFFLIEYSKILFQSINPDYNTNEMATGSTYKGEVHPFAGESKFWCYLKF